MVVAVFGDAHAHGDALDAVLLTAVRSGAEQLWSLGDMIGRGPDPERVVARTRDLCALALMGNHDYAATGSTDPLRFGEPGSPAVRSLELAAERLPADDLAWMRSRRPAARRDGVQCWHGGPHNAVREYVGASNAAACLAAQRAPLGLVGHTHEPAAWLQTPRGARRVPIEPGVPLDLAAGKWILNPGSGRRAYTAAGRLVGGTRRPGRRRCVVPDARPRATHGHVAPRPVRPGTRPGPRRRARALVSRSEVRWQSATEPTNRDTSPRGDA